MSGRSIIFICLVSILFFSCSIVWLGDLKLELSPSEPEEILSSRDRITAEFSEEPDRFSFESIFSLTGPYGDMEGDFHWDTGYVEFSPAEELQPGFRYRLQVIGDLKTAEGRNYPEYIDIPFYYQTDALPPVLTSAIPANAEITGTETEIILTFSKPMDRDSFDEGFTLNPPADFKCDWNPDSTLATISPEYAWTSLRYYCWSISEEVADASGILLPRKISGSFLVQADTMPPGVTGVYPAACNTDGSFSVLTALSADDLLLGQHLALAFSEAIDFSVLRQKLSITPSIDGYIAALDPQTALFYINEDLPPEQEYELSVTEGLTDKSGNPTTGDWKLAFSPSIPAQRITAVTIEDNASPDLTLGSSDFNNDGFITIPSLDYLDTDTLYFYIDLAEGFPPEAVNQRREFVSAISLSALFPPGTSAPSFFSSDWVNDSRIRVIFEDLVSCRTEAPVYYRFTIATGSPESATPGGSYLTDGISFTFLAETE